ncbi:APC family permease [Natrononativus amylolyticus]|uniref:APC family permease n=1 Tax=Natrononativus amylolyticus TaxID=2963434 RepID=UPI0020CE98F6|nr:APC family permease [Natrononativus amylolyticus]
MSDTEFKLINQQIGLLGATALTIGNAVAITMFLLPAHLLADGAGPSIALAAAVTAIPTVFSILLMLQLGGSMPAAGGMYVYASRLVGPFWGFSLPWVAVPAIWLGIIYTGYGFAEYVRFFLPLEVPLAVATVTIPQISLTLLIWAAVVPFLLFNLLGIRFVTTIQYVLVAVIIGGMLLFIVPGGTAVDAGNYTPMFPEGYGPFFVAIVSLFIGMYGFSLALNIGEEIENPLENIPRAIGLSTVIGVSLMVGAVVVAVGAMNWTEWAGAEAGIAVVAEGFLPPWGAALVALAAIVGALTTINTIYVNFSRLVMRAARDEVLPPSLANVHDRFQSPNRAVLLVGVPAVLLVPVAPSPVVMSVVLSLTLLYSIILLGIAAYRLPTLFPDRYEHSFYRLPKPLLYVSAAAGVAIPALFWVLTTTELPIVGVGIVAWIALGYPVYRYRVHRYDQRGIDLESRIAQLHDHEAEQAATGSD